MWKTWHRVALAATATGLMFAGGMVVLANDGDTPKPEDYGLEPDDDGLVEILDSGLNPAVCTFSLSDRGFDVHWINNTDEPQRVVGTHNPNFDTDVIEPGELSKGMSFDYIGSNEYQLESDPSVTGVVRESSQTNCVPQPPTPTPTPTPTNTPTPTITPTPTVTPTPEPTMIPTPEGQQGHAPGVTRDRDHANQK